MRQPAWLPTYDHVHLDFVHLDGDNIIHGTRHELLELCREHNIHRRSITPFSTRMGRGHVIQAPAAAATTPCASSTRTWSGGTTASCRRSSATTRSCSSGTW